MKLLFVTDLQTNFTVGRTVCCSVTKPTSFFNRIVAGWKYLLTPSEGMRLGEGDVEFVIVRPSLLNKDLAHLPHGAESFLRS
jgi:hypothetical protein